MLLLQAPYTSEAVTLTELDSNPCQLLEKVKNLKEFYLQHVAAVAEAAVVVAAAVAAVVVVADAAAAVVDATEFAAVLNPKVSNQKDGASEN